MRSRVWIPATCCAVLALAVACDPPTPPHARLIGVDVIAPDVYYHVDTAFVLRARLHSALGPIEAPRAVVAWEVGASDVATIDATGRLTTLDTGAVTVRARVETLVDSVTLQIGRRPLAAGQSVSLMLPESQVVPGDTMRALVRVRGPAPGDSIADVADRWWSEDTTVARISPEGLISAVAVGDAVIKARVRDRTEQVTLAVLGPITAVDIIPPAAYIYRDTTFAFAATARTAAGAVLHPARFLAWSVTPSPVATMDAAGVLTTTDTGTVTVVVRSGEVADSMSIHVGRSPLLATLIAALRVPFPQVQPGDTMQAFVTVGFPPPGGSWADTVDQWWSDTPSIASVDAAGRVVARQPGAATIRASLRDRMLAVSFSVLEPGQFISLASLDVGYKASCGTDRDSGALLCWGNGWHTPSGSSAGSVTQLGGASGFAQAAVGHDGERCGLLPTRRLLCADYGDAWIGPGAYAWTYFNPNSWLLSLDDPRGCGLLADSTAACWWRGGSVTVQGGGRKFIDLSADGSACGVAADSTAWCWVPRHFPDPWQQTGIPAVVDIEADNGPRCVRTATGDVYCSGDNSRGQLGDGTTVTPTGYVRAIGLPPMVALAGGNSRMCGISNVGEIWCLGLTPERFDGLSGMVSITGGPIHFCALRNDGAAFCWGQNEFGSLGDGTRIDRSTPVRVRRSY